MNQLHQQQYKEISTKFYISPLEKQNLNEKKIPLRAQLFTPDFIFMFSIRKMANELGVWQLLDAFAEFRKPKLLCEASPTILVANLPQRKKILG